MEITEIAIIFGFIAMGVAIFYLYSRFTLQQKILAQHHEHIISLDAAASSSAPSASHPPQMATLRGHSSAPSLAALFMGEGGGLRHRGGGAVIVEDEENDMDDEVLLSNIRNSQSGLMSASSVIEGTESDDDLVQNAQSAEVISDIKSIVPVPPEVTENKPTYPGTPADVENQAASEIVVPEPATSVVLNETPQVKIGRVKCAAEGKKAGTNCHRRPLADSLYCREHFDKIENKRLDAPVELSMHFTDGTSSRPIVLDGGYATHNPIANYSDTH